MGIITGLATLMTVFLVGAVDDEGNVNDPTINERANACFEGGSMAGRCDSELDWQAGWYLIRFETGLLTREDIPSWVAWVIPSEETPKTNEDETPEPNEEEAPEPIVCVSIGGGFGIFVDNILTKGSQLYTTSNCATGPYITTSDDFVIAGSSAEALALCQTIISYYNDANVAGSAWVCRRRGL